MSVVYEKNASVIIGEEKDELVYQIVQHGEVYSLLVFMKDSYGLNDFVFIYDITENKSIADEIIEVLSRNTVTPCTIGYVLEDLFSELNFHHSQ